VGRNVRLAGVEIDLLAREGATTVLVEVKTRRRGGAVGPDPEDHVDARKADRLRRAAAAARAGEVRIDVVAVELEDGAPPRITHYEGAVE
jgi:putative endonuclease